MIEIFMISVIAFGASMLTFFSGFGLGTIMLPVFLLYFPVEIAITLTAVVHFANNIYKLVLTGKDTNLHVLIRFGLPAIPAAITGALLLEYFSGIGQVTSFQFLDLSFELVPVKILIASLLIIFSLFDIVPGLRRIEVDKKYLIPGGVLSGFFGGLSGHQGALRSLFLIRSGLTKESFIATGVVIACLIDISRLSIYTNPAAVLIMKENLSLLIPSTGAAILGAFLGNLYIKKITVIALQKTVAAALIVFAVLLAFGIV